MTNATTSAALPTPRPRRLRVVDVVLVLAIIGVAFFAVGWSPTDAGTGPSGLVTQTPDRILNTRTGPMPGAGATLTVNTGRAGAAAAVVNITSVGAMAPGQFLTAWPAGPRPDTSVLNSDVGEIVANGVIVPLAPDGTFQLYTFAAAHLLVDLTGYFDGGAALPPAGLTASITGYSTAGSITQVLGVVGNGTSDDSRFVRVEVNCPGGELETTSVLLGAFQTRGWSVLCNGLHTSGGSIRGIVDL